MKRIGLAVMLVLLVAGTAAAKDYEVTKKAGDYQVVVKIDRNPPTTGNNNLTVSVKDGAGADITDAKVSVEYSMPAMPGMPAMKYNTAAELAAKEYKTKVNFSMPGGWGVAVKITRGDKTVQAKLVADQVENDATQIALEDAKKRNPAAQVGDYIAEALPPLEYGRIAAQTAKQVILQKVREAERDRQFEEFKDRKGTIINGVVKREEYGNVIVDIGRGEAILRRNEKMGAKATASATASAAISRTCAAKRAAADLPEAHRPEFMAELFKMEVPEIYDGIIEIKAVARDPGTRAKIAVISYYNSIDPVGACVVCAAAVFRLL